MQPIRHSSAIRSPFAFYPTATNLLSACHSFFILLPSAIIAPELAVVRVREVRDPDGHLLRLDHREVDGAELPRTQSEQAETELDGIRMNF